MDRRGVVMLGAAELSSMIDRTSTVSAMTWTSRRAISGPAFMAGAQSITA
jgi:hypothetical protein